jgi:hypothetical protein
VEAASFLKTAAVAAMATAYAIFLPVCLRAESGAPRYEVDRSWPQPLPTDACLGGLGGVCVDRQDRVLLLNRQDVVDGDLNAGQLAPPLIELDPAAMW